MHSVNEKVEPLPIEADDTAMNDTEKIDLSQHVEEIDRENYHGLSLQVVLVILVCFYPSQNERISSDRGSQALSMCLVASNMVLVGSGAVCSILSISHRQC